MWLLKFHSGQAFSSGWRHFKGIPKRTPAPGIAPARGSKIGYLEHLVGDNICTPLGPEFNATPPACGPRGGELAVARKCPGTADGTPSRGCKRGRGRTPGDLAQSLGSSGMVSMANFPAPRQLRAHQGKFHIFWGLPYVELLGRLLV